MIGWGREICGDLPAAERREWLCTNGIGGFASGTVAGLPTRRYHGLLVAALQPPLGRTLLVAKVDETVANEDLVRPLAANRWTGGAIDPRGDREIESFALDGTTPVWTYAVGDALVEKRVWMEQGANTTYVRYRVRRAHAALTLQLRVLVDYRDYHGTSRGDGWRMDVAPVAHGLRVVAFDGARPLLLLADRGDATIAHTWYRGFDLAAERARGLDAVEDHLHAATFRASLAPGETLTLVLSAEVAPSLDGDEAWRRRTAHDAEVLTAWRRAQPTAERAPAWIGQLVLAADQFVVRRPVAGDADGMTVIAGYHWFGDWGRDTMIALPGLTLTTGRPEVARQILRTFARFVDRGMLPNRFPDAGEPPEYNTVDATLWYVEAIRAYHAATRDDGLLKELFPVLAEIVRFHREGTRYGIRVDADGLVTAGEPGVQLTWMDAKVGDWVVTPRAGKAVEINALWYNALRAMAGFARDLGQSAGSWDALADRTRAGFERFWNETSGHCYDVIDGPTGHDAAFRPNQIFAVSLPESPLPPDRRRRLVDACARHLLTSYGLRSLAPGAPEYQGHYGGDQRARDGAYHQGTVWSWLLGPFALAHFRVHSDAAAARSYLAPLAHHLGDAGLGSISEIFDGDSPFTPGGCIAQAWSVAETLRAWHALSAA
ncbi:MAG: glycogen debranching protein [Candidatus Rokuibacteriota bacterium]|nr:MAG: glycogen debranching protein [Candidatus Rokubacteria bacterium]